MKKLAIAAVIATTFSASSFAAQSFDARSTAMGGIGASTASYLTAPFHNPALVAKYGESDDLGVLLPAFGANIQDKGDLIDGFDSTVDAFDNIDAPGGEANAVNALKDLKGDSASLQAGAGLAVAIPNKFVSTNIFVKANLDAFVFSDIDDSDYSGDSLTVANPDELQSTGNVAGIAVIEVGAALAKDMDLGNGKFYYGITPKFQQLETIYYSTSVNSFDMDNFDADENRKSTTAFNIDAGVAYQFNNGIALGLAGTNLIGQTLESVEYAGSSADYDLNPVFTASVSYNTKLFTVGADIDLNETERFESFAGMNSAINPEDDNTQLAAVGVEFNAWDWAQLRAGYQMDIAGNLDNQFSAGVGLSPFGTMRIDLAASYAGENQMGVSLQTSLTF